MNWKHYSTRELLLLLTHVHLYSTDKISISISTTYQSSTTPKILNLCNQNGMWSKLVLATDCSKQHLPDDMEAYPMSTTTRRDVILDSIYPWSCSQWMRPLFHQLFVFRQIGGCWHGVLYQSERSAVLWKTMLTVSLGQRQRHSHQVSTPPSLPSTARQKIGLTFL